MVGKSHLKYLTLLGVSAVLSSMTVIFGALPMRVVRQSFGRIPFWFGYAGMSALMFGLGFTAPSLVLAALAILVGVYTEAEEHGCSAFSSGGVAILASLGASAVAAGLHLYATKTQLLGEIRSQLTPFVAEAAKVFPEAEFTVDGLIKELPSVAIMVMIGSLTISLLGERSLLALMRLPLRGPMVASRKRLLEFRSPDVFVWLTMLAVLGAFIQHGQNWLQVTSTNTLNVLVMVYFLQGLAIVGHAFQTYKVGVFWQSFWYFMIVVQLFLLVALLGFADFWLEFRTRLTRKPAQSNKSFKI